MQNFNILAGLRLSIAEESGLNQALSETPKTGFVVWRPL